MATGSRAARHALQTKDSLQSAPDSQNAFQSVSDAAEAVRRDQPAKFEELADEQFARLVPRAYREFFPGW